VLKKESLAWLPDQAVPKAERLQTPMVAPQLHWYFGLHQTNVLKKKESLACYSEQAVLRHNTCGAFTALFYAQIIHRIIKLVLLTHD
jgi:hypothetical protein